MDYSKFNFLLTYAFLTTALPGQYCSILSMAQMANLIFVSPASNKNAFCEKGGLVLVDALLEKHADNDALTEPACLIIQQLAKLASLRKVIGSSTDIIAHIIAVLRKHKERYQRIADLEDADEQDLPDGVHVLLPAVKALYRLSFNENNRSAIVEAGGIPELLYPLLYKFPSARLHRCIARALLKVALSLFKPNKSNY